MTAEVKIEIIEWIKALTIAVVLVCLFNLFIVPTVVYSVSMYPTLVEKDLLILKKGDQVAKGDIVSFKSDLYLTQSDIALMNPLQRLLVSTKTSKNLIKRVIAGPGDAIKIENNQVFVNGNLLNETYVSSLTIGEVEIKRIPDGQYFFMGDNRSQSMDSRNVEVGTISKDRIIGKVLFRVFPFNKVGVVK